MAKKKAVRSKVQSSSVFSRIQGGVKKMQRDAEAVLGRARKEAVRLSRDQQRALNGAIKEAQRLRADFEKLVKRASKDLESRPKQFLTMIEKEAERRLEPIVRRVLGPSRQEIQKLSRRVRELEQLVQQHSHAEPRAVRAPASARPAEVVSPSSGD